MAVVVSLFTYKCDQLSRCTLGNERSENNALRKKKILGSIKSQTGDTLWTRVVSLKVKPQKTKRFVSLDAGQTRAIYSTRSVAWAERRDASHVCTGPSKITKRERERGATRHHGNAG